MLESRPTPPQESLLHVIRLYALLYWRYATYDNIKRLLKQALETSQITCRFSYGDLIFWLSIYIVLADDLKILTTTREAGKSLISFSIHYLHLLTLFSSLLIYRAKMKALQCRIWFASSFSPSTSCSQVGATPRSCRSPL